MTIEEKAKAYDEAIERAKKAQQYDDCNVVPYIFPILKENEGERIGKALVKYFTSSITNPDYEICGVPFREVLAWLEKQGEQKPVISNDALREGIAHFGITQYQIDNWLKKYVDVEKQGEQKPADKVEPKFKVGDWIVTNKNHIWYVYENPETTSYLYRLINQYGKVEVAEFEVVDNVARLWTIQDAKDGDVLSYRNGQWIFIFKKNGKEYEIVYHLLISDKGLFVNDFAFTVLKDSITPATREQRDLLFQKMREAGYEWDTEKKEIKKIEQSSLDVKTTGYWHVENVEQNFAWSEEDEAMLENIKEILTKQGFHQIQANWLKSLKDRVQSKQEWNEEDDKMINGIAVHLNATTCGFPEDRTWADRFMNWLKSIKDRVQP